ncbi:acyl-CoA N-acyltransferase [Piromyces finnis]|uniref:N-alpha-acetyltransferase 40 n=1 Tax=Piromyces finnis TaxID=1754191 RepID=A0A1Y1VFX3_9FUNG|nr:acyl-CoA N-acyltransferase [Piromyces finnis]|eukprot:ORX55249.1 acyl-CoA N-acyltransferase [Piromyces finnis]
MSEINAKEISKQANDLGTKIIEEIDKDNLHFTINNVNYNIELYTIDNLPTTLFDKLFQILKTNMKKQYQAANIGWNQKKKIKEMKEKDAHYLVVTTDNKEIVGFLYFQFSTEMDMKDVEYPVFYIMEIQLVKKVRNLGIGKKLMDIGEQWSKLHKFQRLMLTVFLKNKDAYRFYEKLGFVPDEISPSQCLDPEEAKEYDYEIMSKMVE